MHFPQLEALRITGIGVYHDAFLSFLLLHGSTLAEIELKNFHTIVSAGRLEKTYYGYDYSECVYGDWVECATLLLDMRQQGRLKKLRLTFESLGLERLTEENRRLFERIQAVDRFGDMCCFDFEDVLLAYCADLVV